MIRLFLVLFPFILFANTPSSVHLNLFYRDAIKQTNNAVHGAPYESGFGLQHFILWDYSEFTPQGQSYVDHYAELFFFLVEKSISKVILFPKDPDGTGNEFFQISNQSVSNENCFAFWVKLFSDIGVKIEIIFEFDAFNGSAPYSPIYALPTDPTAFYFKDLPQKINWLIALMNVVPGAILGVTIDPEGPGSNGNDGYQQVINYIDQYRSTLGPANLHIGMALGIDAKPMTFANLDTFPINPLYISPLADPPTPSAYFPFTLPAYRNGNTAPLLNSVYLEAYEPDFSLIFTENLDPQTAVNTFIQALQDIPYKTSYGTIDTSNTSLTGTYTDGGQFVSEGTITSTQGQTLCSYSGSNFTNEIVEGAYLDYNNNGTIVPIGQVGKNPSPPDPVSQTFYLADLTNGANVTVTNQQFILSQFGIEIISGGIINTLPSYISAPNDKIGAIDGPIPWNVAGYNRALHLFTFDSNSRITLASQHFLGPEVVMKWTYPGITPQIAAGINFIFSVQYDGVAGGNLFFGNWTLANYMAFVNGFISQVSGSNPSNPIFTDSSLNGVGLPATNIGIYDYYLLLQTNANPAQNQVPPELPNPAPSPPNHWFPEFHSP